SIITAIGKPREITKTIFIAAIFNVVINAILIPKYGMNGAAIATTISYLIVLVISIIKISKYIGIKVPVAAWIKTFVLGAIFVFAVSITRNLIVMNRWVELFLAVGAGSIIYIGLVFALKLIDIKEIKRYALLAK
ncbi:polysaccharide biosynthesis C-terminal domain-containing protein, partial [Candidatus Woesearchaeota archaeon]|nr:polysaccharide biosynthesis C-terminal domain-containing protein [Candidatus Woesearchaeota archaeon]